MPPLLPIDPHLPEIIKTLKNQPSLVLEASPGSGKTTRVPPALLSLVENIKAPQIYVLEPRRLAAKYAALRVAEELNTTVGDLVGYHFRFEKKLSPRTRILFLTEGMLMRYLLEDRNLSRASIVVLDEFHERHLHTDLAIGLLKHLQHTSRPDLKILVMSATLDAASVTQYLSGAPFLQITAPSHAVEISYLSEPSQKYLDVLVTEAVRREMERGEEGHVLVFLPGMADIRRAEESLQTLAGRYRFQVFPLHGELDRDRQDQAMKPSKQRKVILSTNVAESSLTIDGVSCVIDSGFERSLSYSAWTGIPSLLTKRISKASAVQRAGRAGRTGPGRCQRLYTQHEFSTWPSFQKAEIHRADLTQNLLELLHLGWKHFSEFPWFEPPPAVSLQTAELLLRRLGATVSTPAGTQMSEIGLRMGRFPFHPRIARMLLEAEKQGCVKKACRLAALLIEGELERADALEQLTGATSFPVRRMEDRLLSLCQQSPEISVEKLPFCVLTGFPDRVAQRRSTGHRANTREVELVLCMGGHACIEENTYSLGNPFFIILDLQESRKTASAPPKIFVRSSCPIHESELLELTPNQVEESESLQWDKQREKITCAYRLKYGLLVLEEKTIPPHDPEKAFQFFLKEGLHLLPEQEESLSAWASVLERFCAREILDSEFARVCLYLEHQKKDAVPLGKNLTHAIQNALAEEYSFQKMRTIEWETFLPEGLLGSEAGPLNRLMPQTLRLHSKRSVRIYYAQGKGPWIESRLQDFFGMKTGPTLLGGKLPLTLHLLAPNQRAVQVTSDLAGFWERSYPKLRQELSRRYPKHRWPENPLKVESDKL